MALKRKPADEIPQPPAPVLLLTVENAATVLDIRSTKMHELIRSGEVETVLVGGTARGRRVVYESLVAYVERLRREQGGTAA